MNGKTGHVISQIWKIGIESHHSLANVLGPKRLRNFQAVDSRASRSYSTDLATKPSVPEVSVERATLSIDATEEK